MKSVGKFLKSQAILCLLALFIVFLAISRPSFVSPTNIKNVLMDASIYGVAAMAMTIAIITGAFDLSLSANFAWAQIFFCFLLNTWGDTAGGILLAFVCTLLSTMAIGAINGLVIVKGDIPAFIATMGMSYMIKGGCLVFTGGDMIATSNTFIAELGKGTFLGQSYLTYIFILVAVVCHLFMKYTQAGRNFYATGGNIVSAKLSGIKVNAYRFATFVILGLAAGLAGCMYVSEIRAGFRTLWNRPVSDLHCSYSRRRYLSVRWQGWCTPHSHWYSSALCYVQGSWIPWPWWIHEYNGQRHRVAIGRFL